MEGVRDEGVSEGGCERCSICVVECICGGQCVWWRVWVLVEECVEGLEMLTCHLANICKHCLYHAMCITYQHLVDSEICYFC